jgi:hypothetical protein
MGNKLLDPRWGDDSQNYTEEELARARARFRRTDAIILVLALLVGAAGLNIALHELWPARDCVQIGEYTCVDTAR